MVANALSLNATHVAGESFPIRLEVSLSASYALQESMPAVPRPVPARRVHRAKPAILVLPVAALAVPQESTKLDECAQTAPRADTIRVRGAHHYLPAERAVLGSTITKSDLSHALPVGKVGTLRAVGRRAQNVPSASTTLTLEALHRLPAGAALRASMPAAQA
jgi:hypothetical protein